jgi:hypothetical protein
MCDRDSGEGGRLKYGGGLWFWVLWVEFKMELWGWRGGGDSRDVRTPDASIDIEDGPAVLRKVPAETKCLQIIQWLISKWQ